MNWHRIHCGLCRSKKLVPSLDLGTTPLANEYVRDPTGVQSDYPLGIVVCEACGHSQISYLVDVSVLFNDYAYATSTSKVTLDHLRNEVDDVRKFHENTSGLLLDSKAFVLEIGCNDGAMLAMWKAAGVGRVLGIDPAASKLKAHDVDTIDAFFTREVGVEIRGSHGLADVVVANNVFAHVPDVLDVAEGVFEVLEEDGLFVFEVSYLLDMAVEPLFDTIYHEHMSYHAVKPLAMMLDKVGLPIVHVEQIAGQQGRGSLRVIACKTTGRSIDCETARVLMLSEAQVNLWDVLFWVRMKADIFKAGNEIRSWIGAMKDLGQSVAGYGAPAKLTTLMYTLKLDIDHVPYVVDDSKWKQGLFTPGKKLPILAPGKILGEYAPDTCVIFAWNFASSIMSKNQGYRGRWVIPLPVLRERKSGT